MRHYKYYYISELSHGTLVQYAGEYGIVLEQRITKPYYAYIAFKDNVLRCGFTDKEIANAVWVLDFYSEKDE